LANEELNRILDYAVRQGASDIHLKIGSVPYYRKNGRLLLNKHQNTLSHQFFKDLQWEILDSDQRESLDQNRELDFAYSLQTVGRFRGNLFYQSNELALVLRYVPTAVKSIKDLSLPSVIEEIAMSKRGLILVTGATGSGKSTTMASMVQHINEHARVHIVTIEDPIEMMFEGKKAIINQRQIASDTTSFAAALRAALRQDPDVIMVGEIRDRDTMETALRAAETGHLVLGTLHTTNAQESISRVIHMFRPEEERILRLILAANLKAVVSMRLLRKKVGEERVPAVEVFRQTERTQDLIKDPSRSSDITHAMAEGRRAYGTQTFDQALYDLYTQGDITLDEATANASNVEDFMLKASGISQLGD